MALVFDAQGGGVDNMMLGEAESGDASVNFDGCSGRR